MPMNSEQAIAMIIDMKQSLRAEDYLTKEDAQQVADLIREQAEQIIALKNPMNCQNGVDYSSRGWECKLDNNWGCGKCSDWEGQR